jgi:hypothetical protein
MPKGPLRIPDRSYGELRGGAEHFLGGHHRDGVIPVPVEDIIERGRIIVEADLARRFDVPRLVITDRMNSDRLWP